MRTRILTGVRVHVTRESALVRTARVALGTVEGVAFQMHHATMAVQTRLELKRLEAGVALVLAALQHAITFTIAELTL